MSLKILFNALKETTKKDSFKQPDFSLYMNVLHVSGLADSTGHTSKSLEC